MKVQNLGRAELNELKGLIWAGLDEGEKNPAFDYSKLSEEEIAMIDNAAYPENIPDNVIYKLFDGVDYKKTDFACNCGH